MDKQRRIKAVIDELYRLLEVEPEPVMKQWPSTHVIVDLERIKTLGGKLVSIRDSGDHENGMPLYIILWSRS